MIQGFKVIVVPPVKFPAKVHLMNAAGKLSYHNRIQKKWNKRYGFCFQQVLKDDEIVRDNLLDGRKALYMNPCTYEKLQKSL